MLKRFILIGLLSFVLVPRSFAQMNVKCCDACKAAQIVHKSDTLFVFKGDIEMVSLIGLADWYSIEEETVVATNIDYNSTLNDGGYYLIKDGVKYSPFYVFKYTEPDIKTLSVKADCEATKLKVEGNLKPFTYARPDGTIDSCVRACSVEYNALAWSGEAWEDSLALKTDKLAKTINLPALYGPTFINLYYDEELRSKLGETDTLVRTTNLKDSDVVAINYHLESLATIRGEKGEKSNELNRPTDQKCITATTSDDYSGPLEVAFYSNPTPSLYPVFYRWSIYKASQLITTRSDQNIRFAFVEPGNYRVVCNVNSNTCSLDSSEMKVNLSESYLRVPNVFTPDGNGKNDEFRVAYRSLREFHCWVYNRWGKLVYEWTDPSKGWDGTINGRPAAESAYFYVIRAMGTDAPKDAGYMSKISYNKKTKNQDESVIGIYQLSGDINLLRGKK